MESHGRPRRRISRGGVVEPRRPAGHSQGRRLGVLWARVIDDLRDFNVLDRGCDAVKVGHLLTKLVGEELKRRLFRISRWMRRCVATSVARRGSSLGDYAAQGLS